MVRTARATLGTDITPARGEALRSDDTPLVKLAMLHNVRKALRANAVSARVEGAEWSGGWWTTNSRLAATIGGASCVNRRILYAFWNDTIAVFVVCRLAIAPITLSHSRTQGRDAFRLLRKRQRRNCSSVT